eukprot:scaffold59117_cov28-Tisochrysis_lutea.AAC.1
MPSENETSASVDLCLSAGCASLDLVWLATLACSARCTVHCATTDLLCSGLHTGTDGVQYLVEVAFRRIWDGL